jgi:outer membrane protein assembly factor BamB
VNEGDRFLLSDGTVVVRSSTGLEDCPVTYVWNDPPSARWWSLFEAGSLYEGLLLGERSVADEDGFICAPGGLTAVDPVDGHQVWAIDDPGTFVADRGAVFLNDRFGRTVRAIDASTGEPGWTIGTRAGPSRTAMAAVDGTLILWQETRTVDPDLQAVAVDERTGERRWRVRLPSRNFPIFAGGDGVLAVSQGDVTLGIGMRSGSILWRVRTPLPTSRVHSTLPVGADGVFYLRSGDDDVIAVRARDGRVLRTFSDVTSLIVTGGRLIYGSGSTVHVLVAPAPD